MRIRLQWYLQLHLRVKSWLFNVAQPCILRLHHWLHPLLLAFGFKEGSTSKYYHFHRWRCQNPWLTNYTEANVLKPAPEIKNRPRKVQLGGGETLREREREREDEHNVVTAKFACNTFTCFYMHKVVRNILPAKVIFWKMSYYRTEYGRLCAQGTTGRNPSFLVVVSFLYSRQMTQ